MSDRKVVLEYEAYKKIKKKKDCYGYLRKTLIHVHTPSSYDYRLLKNWEDKDYKKCSVDKLKEILIKSVRPVSGLKDRCTSGGIIDALQAAKLAIEYNKKR